MCSCRRIAIPQLHKGDKHPFTLLSVQKCLPFFLTHEHLATAFANDSNISWICNGLTQSNSKSESKKSNWNFIKQHKRAGRCEVDGLWVDLLATVQFYPEQKCQTAQIAYRKALPNSVLLLHTDGVLGQGTHLNQSADKNFRACKCAVATVQQIREKLSLPNYAGRQAPGSPRHKLPANGSPAQSRRTVMCVTHSNAYKDSMPKNK